MPDINVIVGDMPCLLKEIISNALMNEPKINIVGKVRNRRDLLDLCAKKRPDIVILDCTATDVEEIGNRLLQQNPNTKVVALTEHGRDTFVYEFRPHKVSVGELSAPGLVRLLTRLLTGLK